MLLNDLLDFLAKYRQSYPHRNIEIRGEMDMQHEDHPIPVKMKIEKTHVTIPEPLPEVEIKNETEGR